MAWHSLTSVCNRSDDSLLCDVTMRGSARGHNELELDSKLSYKRLSRMETCFHSRPSGRLGEEPESAFWTECKWFRDVLLRQA